MIKNNEGINKKAKEEEKNTKRRIKKDEQKRIKINMKLRKKFLMRMNW